MDINITNISSLWERVCLDDDLQAFEKLFHTLNTKLVKFCVFYIRQRESAEDIVTEVFIRCWQSRKKLNEILNLETYLFVAVKNKSLNHIKKNANIKLIQPDDAETLVFVDQCDPEKELERKELNVILNKAISSLPQQACVIFRLIKEDGLKYKEAAELLNISPRTVQTQLFRAIKKLSVLLADYQVSSHYRRRATA